MPQFQLFPLPFWLVLPVLAFLAVKSWQQEESSLRLPMLMVLLTVSVWYIGDVLYNDYDSYIMEIDQTNLQYAWWEVLWFLCAFGFLAPMVHRSLNRNYLGRPSNLLSLIHYGGLKADRFQDELDLICRSLLVVWIAMMSIALIRTDFNFEGLFMPYLGEKADPWGRGRLGGGYDSLLAAAGYFQIFIVATAGIITAMAFRPQTFFTALAIWLLTLPSYIFDRTRSTILATILPGFLTMVFLRMRTGILIKAVILVFGFMVVESWLKFVIENRGDVSIAAAFYNGITFHSDDPNGGKHQGLNMFEELGYINLYIGNGSYRPNWGKRYFAELTNPIPRALWPGKPMIGIDYAIARGQKLDDAAEGAAGVGATISTGMIGQGVVNFGTILGPLASAVLMAYWVAILARQDLLATGPMRLILYSVGLILTFNMGRDITLLVLYPFCFGYLLILATKYWHSEETESATVARPSGSAASVSPTNRIRRFARK